MIKEDVLCNICLYTHHTQEPAVWQILPEHVASALYACKMPEHLITCLRLIIKQDKDHGGDGVAEVSLI